MKPSPGYTVYAPNRVLPYYDKLGARTGRRVNDIAAQMDGALLRLSNERHGFRDATEHGDAYAAACRAHIENLIRHRENMRGWLRELKTILPENEPGK